MKLNSTKTALLLSLAFAFLIGSADLLAKKSDDVASADEEQIEKVAEDYNEAQEDDRSKVVCRKEAVTGTRFKKTVCRSVATIETDERNAKSTLNRMRTFSPGDEGG